MNSITDKSRFYQELIQAGRNYISSNDLTKDFHFITLNIITGKDYYKIEKGLKCYLKNQQKRELKNWVEELESNDLIKKFEQQQKGIIKVWINQDQLEQTFN